MPKEDWKEVTPSTYRLKVPGGWLYRASHGEAITMCFVPIPSGDELDWTPHNGTSRKPSP